MKRDLLVAPLKTAQSIVDTDGFRFGSFVDTGWPLHQDTVETGKGLLCHLEIILGGCEFRGVLL